MYPDSNPSSCSHFTPSTSSHDGDLSSSQHHPPAKPWCRSGPTLSLPPPLIQWFSNFWLQDHKRACSLPTPTFIANKLPGVADEAILSKALLYCWKYTDTQKAPVSYRVLGPILRLPPPEGSRSLKLTILDPAGLGKPRIELVARVLSLI